MKHSKNIEKEINIGSEENLIFLIDSVRYLEKHDSISLCSTLGKIRQEIKNGGNVNIVHPVFGIPMLSMAIKNQSIDLIELLLENNANPNEGGDGLHPVLLAANCFEDAISSLLKYGAKLDQETLNGTVGVLAAEALEARGKTDSASKISKMTEQSKKIDYKDSEANVMDETHTLYDVSKLQKEIANEKNDSRLHYLKRLSESGAIRSYRKANESAQFSDLYELFPNFEDTLDTLSDQIALSNLSENSIFTLRPILLVGPPGVGKTRFAREVAKRLNLEFNNISCGGITAGWILSGSSVSWSDGRPGMVHTALRDGKSANPIIMLDEIDKLSGDSRFSGFGPLYQLLDKDMSNEFSDEAVGLPIDCSHVSWIATANSLDSIPEAIISRFTVIEVESPTELQMVNVIKSIYADILDEHKNSWGGHFEKEVNEDMISSLQGKAPREIVKMILTAIGRSARSRGSQVTAENPLIRLEAMDFKDFSKPKVKMGF